MKRLIGLFAVLALCLPMVGEGQSIQYKSPGGLSELTSSGSAITSTVPILLPDGSGAAPSLRSSAVATTGLFFSNGSRQINLQSTSPYTISMVSNASGSGFEVSPGNYAAPIVTDSISLGQATVGFTNAYVLRSTQGSKTKALTEGAATTVATVAVPQTAGSNFAAGEVQYTVYASDGTDTQTLNGSAFFSAVNKAGTEACQITDDQIGTEAASAGTLVCTVACAVGLTDVVGITFDCTSSLTQTSLNALVRFDMQKTNTIVFP